MSNKPKQNIEVELRTLVKDFDSLKKQIEKIGAKYLCSSFLHDIYFCNKRITTVEDAEMHEVGSYSLRLRKYTKGD